MAPTETELLREKLAALAHNQWSGWMKYLFEKCEDMEYRGPGVSERVCVIPAWAVERWKRQLGTPYDALPEEEKESDRKEADRVLEVVGSRCSSCGKKQRSLCATCSEHFEMKRRIAELEAVLRKVQGRAARAYHCDDCNRTACSNANLGFLVEEVHAVLGTPPPTAASQASAPGQPSTDSRTVVTEGAEGKCGYKHHGLRGCCPACGEAAPRIVEAKPAQQTCEHKDTEPTMSGLRCLRCGAKVPAKPAQQTEAAPVSRSGWLDLTNSLVAQLAAMTEDRNLWRAHCESDGLCPAAAQQTEAAPRFDLVAHLHRQRAFSEKTFGPGARTTGVLDHIRKELREIESAPADLTEWIDVVLLALDGAWRAGHAPEEIAAALGAKQAKNEGRSWPDWRTAEPGKAIEHVRTALATLPKEDGT